MISNKHTENDMHLKVYAAAGANKLGVCLEISDADTLYLLEDCGYQLQVHDGYITLFMDGDERATFLPKTDNVLIEYLTECAGQIEDRLLELDGVKVYVEYFPDSREFIRMFGVEAFEDDVESPHDKDGYYAVTDSNGRLIAATSIQNVIKEDDDSILNMV